MSSRHVVAVAVAILIGGSLTACASQEVEAAPPSEPTASQTPAPTPTPTPTVLVVGPGQRPPALFDGDCDQMLSPEEVTAVLGRPGTLDTIQASTGYNVMAGAGGLHCVWVADNVDGLHVAVFPESGVSEVDLAAVDPDRVGDDCTWYCGVVSRQDGYVVVTNVNGIDARHDDAVRTSALVTPLAVANARATAEPWIRDRTGWCEQDCAQLGAEVSADLGMSLTGEEWGIYIDPPLTAGLLADEAARFWACRLVDDAGQYAEVWAHSGAAWGAGDGLSSSGLPAPWQGRAVEEEMRNDFVRGSGRRMTDGVNLVTLSPVPIELGVDVGTLATAVAAALTP
ncbi:hypothetical protein [Microbacterium pumilum]|uniref:DUF3558 domain-containing protein n=1 Tax=Microbacterium pumilum TaxID=344165 RepID=A0ABP5DKJ3_9MICO